MTTLDQPAPAQPGQADPQQPVPPGTSPSQTNVPGLPPTALDQQITSLNDEYAAAQGQQLMGASLAGTGGYLGLIPEPGAGSGAPAAGGGGAAPEQYGTTSLQDLAEKMASGYGLNFGRGTLVDQQGNFLQTPEQLAAVQGGAGQEGMGSGEIAASMNYIAQALNDQKIQGQQQKAIAALQTGLGLVQKGGRGSLAALQSGFFQNMASVYTDPNLLPEQQDFSYWIQKEQMDEAAAIRADDLTGLGGGGMAAGSTIGGFQQPTYGDSSSVDTYPGTGVPTSGPNAGLEPYSIYDPVSKTTSTGYR